MDAAAMTALSDTFSAGGTTVVGVGVFIIMALAGVWVVKRVMGIVQGR